MSQTIQLPPDDVHNRKLVSNVHPADWVNPQPARRYNLVVIGAGTAGLVTAAGAAGLGAKVALIERHLMGGDCLNVGCVPSKGLIRASRAYAAVRDAGEFGIEVPKGTSVNYSAVMQRMRRLRADISHLDSAPRFQELGVDVFLGQGSFSGSNTIQVDDKTLPFKKAVIATGARATAIQIPGLDEAEYLTNETLFSLTELPKRLAVIGAGPIGCEMAQCFARFGSKVTLFQSRPQILFREDSAAAEIIAASMIQDGVELLTGSKILEIRTAGNEKTIIYEQDGEQQERIVDTVLVAVGRAPNVEGLNLEQVGVEFDHRSGVKVDDQLRTTNPKIFACGDICFPYKFTHTADFQARIVIGNSLFLGRSKASKLTISWCTYTSPEIAHVGLCEKEAEKQGILIDTFEQPLAHVDRAILDGEDEGFVKVHVKKGTDTIVGATIVAAHAGEMISEITLAMVGGLGLKKIGSVIHPYPTQAEAIRKLGDLYSRTRLTPPIKFLFKSWLAWTR
jgi:pyruvate/2-oxoglutarate dehydrogenase complex dihydrolipoamide dehydrogenase (E3) component